MTLILVLLINLATMAAVFLAVLTFIRAPDTETDYRPEFAVRVDNVDRATLFDYPVLLPVVGPLHAIARRLNIPGFRDHITRLLQGLGNPNQYTADEFVTVCMVWGLIAGTGAVLGGFLVHGTLSLVWGSVYVGAGFVVGFFVTYLLLRERALARLRAISKRLPYTLDLVAMAMDAGATFYEAASAVIKDDPEDPLNEELSVVVREIDFGRSRQDALVHLGERLDVDSLDSIISAVIQAEQLGTPLATVLKLQANLLRMRRSMKAERRAGEATVKMLVPMMLVLLSVVLVIFAPIIVKGLRGDYRL